MSLRPYHELAQQAGITGVNTLAPPDTTFGKVFGMITSNFGNKALQRAVITAIMISTIFMFFFVFPTVTNGSEFLIFPLFCLTPIVAGGVVLLGYNLIIGTLFSQPTVGVSTVILRRGDELQLHYQQNIKRSVTFKAMTFSLVLRESATYDSGSSTVTEHHDHVVDQDADFEVHISPDSGVDRQLSFTLSDDAMHSFEATRNTLNWYLKVHFDVARFPDFEKMYLLKVLSEVRHES